MKWFLASPISCKWFLFKSNYLRLLISFHFIKLREKLGFTKETLLFWGKDREDCFLKLEGKALPISGSKNMTWNVGYNYTEFSVGSSEMSILCYQFSWAFTENPLFKLSLSLMHVPPSPLCSGITAGNWKQQIKAKIKRLSNVSTFAELFCQRPSSMEVPITLSKVITLQLLSFSLMVASHPVAGDLIY